MIFEPGKAYFATCDQGMAWMEDPCLGSSPRRHIRMKEGQIVICVGSKVDERHLQFAKFLVGERASGWVPLKETHITRGGVLLKEI